MEGNLEPVLRFESSEYLDEETSLWWASKELLPNKKLSDYVGKNEKTKIIVKLTKKGAGQPGKEPLIDEPAYKKMMAYYYKK